MVTITILFTIDSPKNFIIIIIIIIVIIIKTYEATRVASTLTKIIKKIPIDL